MQLNRVVSRGRRIGAGAPEKLSEWGWCGTLDYFSLIRKERPATASPSPHYSQLKVLCMMNNTFCTRLVAVLANHNFAIDDDG